MSLILASCTRSGDDAAESQPTDSTTATTAAARDECGPDEPRHDHHGRVTITVDSTAAPTLPPPAAPVTVVDLAEVGTPGLDSDDAFCCVVESVRRVVPGRRGHRGVRFGAARTAGRTRGRRGPDGHVRISATCSTTGRTSSPTRSRLVADEFLGPFARRHRRRPRGPRRRGCRTTTPIEAISRGVARRPRRAGPVDSRVRRRSLRRGVGDRSTRPPRCSPDSGCRSAPTRASSPTS